MRRIRTIICHNAQKFQERSFDVDAPVVVITGPPESGKTTLVRAVQAALGADPGAMLYRPSVASTERVNMLGARGPYHVEVVLTDGSKAVRKGSRQSGPTLPMLYQDVLKVLTKNAEGASEFFAKLIPDAYAGWDAGLATVYKGRLAQIGLAGAPYPAVKAALAAKVLDAQSRAKAARTPSTTRSVAEINELLKQSEAIAAERAVIATARKRVAEWDAHCEAVTRLDALRAKLADMQAPAAMQRKLSHASALAEGLEDGAPCPCCGRKVATPGFWDKLRDYFRDAAEYHRDYFELADEVEQLQRRVAQPPVEANPAMRQTASKELPFASALLPAPRELRIELEAAERAAAVGADALAQAELDEAYWQPVLTAVEATGKAAFDARKADLATTISALMGRRSDGSAFPVTFYDTATTFAPLIGGEVPSGFTEVRLVVAVAMLLGEGVILPDDRQMDVVGINTWLRALSMARGSGQVFIQTTLPVATLTDTYGIAPFPDVRIIDLSNREW